MKSFVIPGVNAPLVPHPDGTRHDHELGQASVDVLDARAICPYPQIKGRDALKTLHGTRRRNWIVRGSGIVSLSNAICAQGELFSEDNLPVMGFSGSSLFRNFIVSEKPFQFKKILPRISEKSVVVFMSDTKNYYHFITDVMPNLARAASAMKSLDANQLVIYGEQPEGGFRKAFLDLFLGRLEKPIIYKTGPLKIDDGYFIINFPHGFTRDPDTNELQTVPHVGAYPFPAAEGMWDFFSAFDQNLVDLPEPPVSAPILIASRAHLDNRKIVNEDELLVRLEPLGARQIVFEDYTVLEQISMVRASRVLIGCHGAGMINAGFLCKGGRAIEVTSRQYASRSRDFARLSHIRPIRYSFILADEHGERFEMTSNLGNNIIMSHHALDAAYTWIAQTIDNSPQV